MSKKKILWALLSVLIAGLTIWAVASQSKSFSPAALWELIQNANKGYLIAALCAMFGYIWFEGLSVISVTNSLGYKKTPLNGTVYGAADVYFSAITPSASGGQPACAWFMLRDKIPGAVVTVSLLITLVMYTMALLLSGVITVLFNVSVFKAFSRLSQLMVIIGCTVLLFLGLFFLILLIRPNVLQGICNAFLRFLEKIHLMRSAKKLRRRLDTVMEEYALCSRLLFGKGFLIFKVFLWNLCQRLSYFLVTFLLFMAVGKGSAMAAKATVVQCLACAGSNCIPIPGAMGAADYMLLDGFGQFLSEESAVTMEMLCRGVTFYGSVSTGLIIVIIGYIVVRMRNKK